MDKIAIYGFSLLSYVQRVFNSNFRVVRLSNSTADARSREQSYSKFEPSGLEPEAEAGARRVESRVVDISERRDLDLVEQSFGGCLDSREMECLGCAVAALGGSLPSIFYEISQWSTDCYRDRLGLVSTSCPKGIELSVDSLGRVTSPNLVAYSIGDNIRGRVSWRGYIPPERLVTVSECHRLAEEFMASIRESGGLSK